jgi:hypothetical protein
MSVRTKLAVAVVPPPDGITCDNGVALLDERLVASPAVRRDDAVVPAARLLTVQTAVRVLPEPP